MQNKIRIVAMVVLMAAAGRTRAEMETVLKVYTVQKGDTFHAIAGKLYKDEGRWKEIWNYNQYIKKPHWIFPGDTLIVPTYREKVEKKEKASAEEIKAEEAERNPENIIAPYYADMEKPVDFKYAGKITAFTEKEVIHSQFSKVILDIGASDGVKLNDKFDVYRAERQIQNPETREIMGVLIKKIGQVVVTDDIQGKSSIATIKSSKGSIQIGDYTRRVPEEK